MTSALRARLVLFHATGSTLLLVVLACAPYASVTSVPGGRFTDSDAQFHARRVVRTIQQGALLPPVFDPFENFPDGGKAVWAPLHDAALSMAARLGGSTAAEPLRGMTAAAAVPVLLLALVALVATLLAARIAGPRGAVAGWLIALTPALLRRGSFGELDHNVTEVLFALLLAGGAAFVPREGSMRQAIVVAAACAPAVLVALGFFPGLVLAALLAAGGMFVADLADRGERSAGIALGLALAAALLPFFAGIRATPDPADPWRLGPVFSLVLSGAAVGLGVAVLASSVRRARSASDGLALAATALGLGVGFVLPRASWQALLQGTSFFGARDPWLAVIAEFQPLYGSWEQLTRSFPAVPVALVGLVVASRGLLADRRVLIVGVPFVAYLGLALAQQRYAAVAAAFAALIAGIFWARATGLGRAAMTAGFAVALLACGSALLTTLDGYTRGRLAAPGPIDVTADALRTVTPDPGSPPEWGVLAPWGFGHEILWRSGRAVAVGNFGSAHPGFRRALRIYLDPSPAHALAELRALRLRYVVTLRPRLHVPASAAVIGDDPSRFYDGVLPSSYLATGAERPPARLSLFVRLHEEDGRPRPEDGEEDRRALERFRLVWQSPQMDQSEDGRTVPYIQIHEVRLSD